MSGEDPKPKEEKMQVHIKLSKSGVAVLLGVVLLLVGAFMATLVNPDKATMFNVFAIALCIGVTLVGFGTIVFAIVDYFENYERNHRE